MKIYNKIKSIQISRKQKNISPLKNETPTQYLSRQQLKSKVKRSDVINYLITEFNFKSYLEIGVRNPNDNFSLINVQTKYSVDPGIEYKQNPVNFKMTSDTFFLQLSKGEILDKNIKFDVIFIDGLHLAEQVQKDIVNSSKIISENGFIILHDCNPPTEWHAREDYSHKSGPAGQFWNGTTWKAFLTARKSNAFNACCIDTDWGIGVLSKRVFIPEPNLEANFFFEFKIFDENRVNSLNLISFNEFKEHISKFIKNPSN